MEKIIKNIVFVEEYTTKIGEKKKKYTNIGTSFESVAIVNGTQVTNQSLVFDLVPVNMNKGFINVMARLERKD